MGSKKTVGRCGFPRCVPASDVKSWRGRGNDDGNAWAGERRLFTPRGKDAIDMGYGDIYIYIYIYFPVLGVVR